MICKLCRRLVALDTNGKTPLAKVHFAKNEDARPCPCKEAIEVLPDEWRKVVGCCCSFCAS